METSTRRRERPPPEGVPAYGRGSRPADRMQLISKEHFTVDGTLMEAWASLKSFKPKSKGDDDRGPPEHHPARQDVWDENSFGGLEDVTRMKWE